MSQKHILFFSQSCIHCQQCISLLTPENPASEKVIFFDVGVSALPKSYEKIVSRVPTLVKTDGNVLKGKDVRMWILNQIPSKIEYLGNFEEFAPFGSNGTMPTSRFSSLEDQNMSLAAEMTPELEEKINRKVDKGIAYSSVI